MERNILNVNILGAGNSQKQKIEWQLINFLVGQAKLAIHGFHVTSHSGAARHL